MRTNVTALPIIYGDAELSFFDINIKANPPQAPAWHRHSYYEAHVCRRTPVNYTFEDKSVTLCEGQVLIIPPNVSHISIDRELHPTDELFVISFNLKRIKSDKRFYRVFTKALDCSATIPLMIKPIAKLNLERFDDSSSYRTVKGICRLTSVATAFISHLFDAIVRESEDVLCEKKETDILIDNMINQSDATLDDIARATSYSKRHVSRLIKNKYGVSLRELRKPGKRGHQTNES